MDVTSHAGPVGPGTRRGPRERGRLTRTSPPALMLLEADEKLLEVPEVETELARLPLGGGRIPAVHDDPVGGDDGPGPVFSVAAMDEHGLFRTVPDNVQGLVDLFDRRHVRAV